MRLIYNSDAQRLQKNFDDKTPVTVSELFRSERTASVPIELFLVDNDGGYATPGSSDYEVLIGRQAQAVTTGKLTLTFTGTTEEIDLSKPKLATRIEAALNAVSEVNAAGGVDVVELKNGRAFQITFRSVGSRAAITAGVKDSMQPASVLISEVTAGTGSTREVQLLTLEEASLAEVSTSGWSANSNPALTITTLVEGTANTREVVQLSVSNDPAPGSFFVVSNSEPISTEATAAQVKTILNSALSNDIGSVKKTGERIWQITYKTNGDKTALSAGTHNLVKRPSVNATLSLNTTALAYAANSDGSDLSVGFTLKKSNEVLLSENVDLAEPFAEVIGSSAMLNNDSLGALFTIAGDDVNKGTAISLSGGLTYSSDTLAAPFLPLAGGTMTGDAVFNDGVKAIFGTSSDGLEIYHSGSDSIIADTGTGDLIIQGSDDIWFRTQGGQNYARFAAGGSVELRYANNKKFETTDTGATISGKLIVNGDLDVSGTTTTFNSTVVTVDDPVFTVGGDTAPDSSDNKDRGIEFRYFRSGESAKVGFFGYDNSENAFTFFTDATNNSEVFSGTLGNLKVKTVYFADGTQASPSVRFNVDSDTGIFRPTANNLAFTTGGTEAARFDSSGRLGIGCTPTARLEIATTSQGDTALQVGYTTSTPNLLVGTSTGSTKLEIANGNYHHKFYSRNASGTAVERLAIEGGSDIADIKIINSNLGIGGTPIAKTYIESDNNSFAATGTPSNYHLVLRNSQNDLNEGVGIGFTSSTGTDSIGAAIAFERTGNQAQGDLVFSAKSSTSAGASLDELMRLDGSASSVNIPDSVKLKLGGGGDLQLYHDGNHSYMINDVGHLYIRNQTDDNDIIFQCDDGSGGVTPYLRLDGASGYTKAHKEIRMDDSIPLRIGTGGDARLVHDGSNTYLDNYTGDFYIRQAAADKDIVFKADDGSGGNETYFYLDGSASSGNPVTNFPDNSALTFGNDRDYWIYHDGTDSRISNYVGDLVIRNYADDKDIVFVSDDGAGNTTDYLRLDGSSSIMTAHKKLRFIDNVKATFGYADDLEIYHDGSNSYITDGGTGNLLIKGASVEIQTVAGNKYFTGSSNVAKLYHTNNEKLATTLTGVSVTGRLTASEVAVSNIVTNKIVKFNGTLLDDSIITDDGSSVTVTGNLGIGGAPSANLQIDTPAANNAGQGIRINRPTAGNNYHSLEFSTNGTVDWSVGQNVNDAFEVYENGSSSLTRFTIKEGGNVGINSTSPSANADLTLGNGELCMAETTTPTADANFGKIYCKSDNKLYFQDGAGTEHEIAFV